MPRIADLPASQLIRFLAAYGPDENNQNLFDENAQRASRINRIDSFDLEAKDVPEIVKILKGSGPVSVLIAGVAGDGKSYHLRQVWRALGGSPEVWEKNPEPSLPIMTSDCGWRLVHFINDLSAYDDGNRFPELWQQLSTAGSGHAFVIACNHGKILQCLRTAGNPEGIADKLEDFFFKADETERIGGLWLFDLSRTSQAENLEEIFRLICSQPKWDACENEYCEYLQDCPIRKNLGLLWDRVEGKPTAVTKRLCELVRLAAFDGIHFPIRELFILAVNALLGRTSTGRKTKAKSSGATADCHLVRRMRRKEIDPVEINAFRNLLGRNLRDRVRLKKSLFRLLDLFEIGRYSDPFFDNLILTGKTSEDPKKRALFLKYLGDLPEAPAQEDCEDWDEYWAKRSAWLEEARARLFFRWEEPGTADVWALTAYRHARQFLKLRDRVSRNSDPNQGIPDTIIDGLTRAFTGYPCNGQSLRITTNGAESRTPAGDLIVGTLSTDPDDERAVIRSSGNKPDAVPVLVFQPRPHAGEAAIKLKLTPRRYEFLCGVAEGALPASFSEQCQAELFALKATLIQACLKKNTGRDTVQLKLINADGSERFDIRTCEVLKDTEED